MPNPQDLQNTPLPTFKGAELTVNTEDTVEMKPTPSGGLDIIFYLSPFQARRILKALGPTFVAAWLEEQNE